MQVERVDLCCAKPLHQFMQFLIQYMRLTVNSGHGRAVTHTEALIRKTPLPSTSALPHLNLTPPCHRHGHKIAIKSRCGRLTLDVPAALPSIYLL